MLIMRRTLVCGLLALSACAIEETPVQSQTATAARPERDDGFLTATIVPPIAPMPSATLAGPLATIIAKFDMGAGMAAFDAMIYGQEVFTGKTYGAFMSVGDHHAEAVFRVEPVILLVQAPGTFVFYARLTYTPETYHWGATGCPALTECGSKPLMAIDVRPDQTYEVTISDRSAILPVRGEPVTVPWVR